MIISLVNFSEVSDADVQYVIRAINRQISQDFEPYWSMGARLRLEGRAGVQPMPQSPAELRGDAIIYLWDRIDVAGVLGYHAENNQGIPYSFVLMELSAQLGEPWSVTLSHEALEVIGDANVNQFAAGPHPDPNERGRMVFHWYEMCDAVQAESYDVDGIRVSDFVLPLYFTIGEQPGARNDFLGTSLQSFGVNPGGYVGFFDPVRQDMETWTANAQARMRLEIKASVGLARRSMRYAQLATMLVPDLIRTPGPLSMRRFGTTTLPLTDNTDIVVKVQEVG
jgi:hypothetical protein